jgi:hypothetical protein
MLTGLGAHFAMLVHLGMSLTLRGAGAREGDTGGELGFQELPMTDLVGARQDASGRSANRRTILIEADAGDQTLDMLFREARIRACGTGYDTAETRLDTTGQRIRMSGLLRMPAKHGPYGGCGHEYLPF